MRWLVAVAHTASGIDRAAGYVYITDNDCAAASPGTTIQKCFINAMWASAVAAAQPDAFIRSVHI